MLGSPVTYPATWPPSSPGACCSASRPRCLPTLIPALSFDGESTLVGVCSPQPVKATLDLPVLPCWRGQQAQQMLGTVSGLL